MYRVSGGKITLDRCNLLGSASVSGSTLVMVNSTVSGGGIAFKAFSMAELTNCTVVGSPSGSGVVVDVELSAASLWNCTVATAVGKGGTVNVDGSITQPASLTMHSSIVGELRVWSGGTAAGSRNLIGSLTGVITGTGNQVGATAEQLGLLPLGDFGGPTPTMALKYNSARSTQVQTCSPWPLISAANHVNCRRACRMSAQPKGPF